MRSIAIIPARFASTRFPAKPLALLGGKSIVQRVYEQVAKAVERVVVATDDERIYNAVVAFGGEAVMTSSEHRSGTDRCAEAYEKLGCKAEIVINEQGDEPFIEPKQIATLIECFNDDTTDIATLAKPFAEADGIEVIENPNSPKVVFDNNGNAILFSRSVIPFVRGIERSEWAKHHTFYKHIGIYAFRGEVLGEIAKLQSTPLEKAESLEQLRWLEHEYKIKVGITSIETIGIDTPSDLERAELFLQKKQNL
jgi:3-deoxy-manno-octulosonate cytidylyltransferase (CMP-KDO synthetase)